ncbi:hypothetical protein C8F01DRAFT_1212314 [Mycena amicta]|nr:hypothetical protein C8F01DRAFT_1212314 [Mycena amicta]
MDSVPRLDDKVWDERPVLLNLTLAQLDREEIDFLVSQTGIQDLDMLRRHVLRIQKKGYAIESFPCILHLNFARSNHLTGIPAYSRVSSLLRQRPNAIMLDMACGFGTDVRKAVADGFPARNVVACDLQRDFWDLGHELFKSTSETFPVRFLAGDIFDQQFLNPGAPPPTSAAADSSLDLSSLSSLTPLNGRVSVLHTSMFFHLFDRETQANLARILAGLLSPVPGSMIFGAERKKPKFLKHDAGPYCHSPSSWRKLWEGLFPERAVRVEAELRTYPGLASTGDEDASGMMVWSCTRV